MKKIFLIIFIICFIGGVIYLNWSTKSKKQSQANANYAILNSKDAANSTTKTSDSKINVTSQSLSGAPSDRKGCTDRRACNYDENALYKTECTYATYDLQIASPKSRICKPGASDAKLERPSNLRPVSAFPRIGNQCATDPIEKDGDEPTGRKIYNINIHSWTISETGQIITRSNTFLGSFAFETEDEAKEYQGKNACDSLKK